MGFDGSRWQERPWGPQERDETKHLAASLFSAALMLAGGYAFYQGYTAASRLRDADVRAAFNGALCSMNPAPANPFCD